MRNTNQKRSDDDKIDDFFDSLTHYYTEYGLKVTEIFEEHDAWSGLEFKVTTKFIDTYMSWFVNRLQKFIETFKFKKKVPTIKKLYWEKFTIVDTKTLIG